jgi:uncharacterized protein (TIGR00725 family)
MRPYVGVVGPGDAAPELERLAYEVGERLARAGAVVLCGGLGGVMAAAARGAAAGEGTSIGLLPGTDRTAAAEAVTYALATGLGQLRNGLLVSASDGLISVGSSWGTLNEVALAVRVGKPVVALRGWSITDNGTDLAGILPAQSPEHAVTQLFQLLT